MSLKALLFDVDGTLAETEETHRIAFNAAFEQFSLDWHWDYDLYCKLLSVTGGKERMRHYATTIGLNETDISDDTIRSIHLAKTDIYIEKVERAEICLRPGIEKLINDARAANLELAIVTTTSDVNAKRLIAATLGSDAISWFSVWATGDRVKRKKPDGEIYQLALDELKLCADECAAIEDAPQGLAAARAVSVPTIVTVSSYSVDMEFNGAMRIVGLDDPRPTLNDIQSLHMSAVL